MKIDRDEFVVLEDQDWGLTTHQAHSSTSMSGDMAIVGWNHAIVSDRLYKKKYSQKKALSHLGVLVFLMFGILLSRPIAQAIGLPAVFDLTQSQKHNSR